MLRIHEYISGYLEKSDFNAGNFSSVYEVQMEIENERRTNASETHAGTPRLRDLFYDLYRLPIYVDESSMMRAALAAKASRAE
ncbi:hypothetical protein H0H92_010118 [Tricholoma furcatifolium]|nr:hypothetical protein H0H92_010118 [Tricholoma furcatifolium]